VICITTVGRLWYVPGALLVLAGLTALLDLRREATEVRAVLSHHWLAGLTAILASFYVFLGTTALGFAGIASSAES